MRPAALLALAAAAALLLAAAGVRPAAAAPAACPSSAANVPASRNPRAHTELVPPGATSALVCRYAGLNAGARSRHLIGSGLVQAPGAVAALVREFGALPHAKAVFHCPMDDGSAILAVFRYRSEPPDPVRVDLTGCRTVSNGHVTRNAVSPAGAPLVARLEALVARRCPAALAGAHDLGTLAFLRGHSLVALDVARCRERTLVSSGTVAGPVSFSADGRYVAFGSRVVAAAGGRAARPLPGANGTLAWAPGGDELAGVTVKGGVLVGGPRRAPRRLLPDGFGAIGIAWSPSGRQLAVARSRFPKRPYDQEIWLVDVRSGARSRLFALPNAKIVRPELAGFSPDGRWLLAWEDGENSASLAADGLPLVAIRVSDGRAVTVENAHGATLVFPDFLSWCGDTLAYVWNRGGREVTLGDRIVIARPPGWKAVFEGPAGGLSYVSPACSPAARFEIAASAGPVTQDSPFGKERRRIRLLRTPGGTWRAVGPQPPRGESDELPTWSRDGPFIAFVRSGPTSASGMAPGAVYLLDLRSSRTIGPLANLGETGNYFGRYGWASQLAWWTPR